MTGERVGGRCWLVGTYDRWVVLASTVSTVSLIVPLVEAGKLKVKDLTAKGSSVIRSAVLHQASYSCEEGVKRTLQQSDNHMLAAPILRTAQTGLIETREVVC